MFFIELSQRFCETRGNDILFEGSKIIFIYLFEEQGTSLLLMGTSPKTFLATTNTFVNGGQEGSAILLKDKGYTYSLRRIP